jgi:hypothetical protein
MIENLPNELGRVDHPSGLPVARRALLAQNLDRAMQSANELGELGARALAHNEARA